VPDTIGFSLCALTHWSNYRVLEARHAGVLKISFMDRDALSFFEVVEPHWW